MVVQPDASFDWSTEIQQLNHSAPENQTHSIHTPPDNIAFMTHVHGLTAVEGCHYRDAKETINALTKELDEIKQKYQINEVNIKKYEICSKLVKDLCDIQLEYKGKKGCGLGYNKVPPPFNHNYTYLTLTVEELVNADTMTYGPKTDKTSIDSKYVEKRTN
ncbi:hypothetical protein Hanom_Chr02g00141121 [Helianthus anomalus]